MANAKISDAPGGAASVILPSDEFALARAGATMKAPASLFMGFDVWVIKTLDEIVAASTTFQDDNELRFQIGSSATEVWFFECFVLYSAPNATMDIKFAVTVPAAASLSAGVGHVAGASLAGFNAMVSTGTPVALQNTSGASLGALATLNGQLAAMPSGWVFGGGTGGDVRLQWAQNTSDGGNLTVKKASFLRARKVVA